MVLAIPAAIGFILHLPLYQPVKALVKYKSFTSGHYDSILAGTLFLIYPFYLLLVAIIVAVTISLPLALLSLVVIPFTAWAAVQLKKQ
jgi:hypothetical protein